MLLSQESIVHARPSLHVLGVCWQPNTGSQVEMKQAFKVQLIGVNTHPVELTQVSSVQTVLSLQGAFGALKQYRGGKPEITDLVE